MIFPAYFRVPLSFPPYILDGSERELRLMPRKIVPTRLSGVGARQIYKCIQDVTQRREVRKNLNPPSYIEESITVIGEAMRDQSTDYYLVPSARINASNSRKRSEAYKFYTYLCYKNTPVCAGYLVCKYAFTDSCRLEKVLRH